jgi:hypothetical protein
MTRPAQPSKPPADLLDDLQLEWTPTPEPVRTPTAEALHEARVAGQKARPVIGASSPVTPQVSSDGPPQGPMIVPWRTWRGPDEPIRITMPGVYQLDEEVYFSDPVPGGSLSNSGVKKLLPPGSPARYRYDLDNQVVKTSDAFDLGHAVHKLALGAGAEIAVRPAEFDSYRSKAAQAWLAEQRAARRIPVKPEEFEQARAMADALLADEYAGRLLRQPGKPEQAMFWPDPATGVWRRILVDYLPDRPGPARSILIVDVKTCESASPDDDMSRDVYKYRYHRQAATAIDGALALGLAESARFFDLFVEKKPPYLVCVVELDERAIRIGRYENAQALELFAQCQATGEWPGYERTVLPLPRYIENQYDGVI